MYSSLEMFVTVYPVTLFSVPSYVSVALFSVIVTTTSSALGLIVRPPSTITNFTLLKFLLLFVKSSAFTSIG